MARRKSSHPRWATGSSRPRAPQSSTPSQTTNHTLFSGNIWDMGSNFNPNTYRGETQASTTTVRAAQAISAPHANLALSSQRISEHPGTSHSALQSLTNLATVPHSALPASTDFTGATGSTPRDSAGSIDTAHGSETGESTASGVFRGARPGSQVSSTDYGAPVPVNRQPSEKKEMARCKDKGRWRKPSNRQTPKITAAQNGLELPEAFEQKQDPPKQTGKSSRSRIKKDGPVAGPALQQSSTNQGSSAAQENEPKETEDSDEDKVIKMPWELDSDYPNAENPQHGKLTFNYRMCLWPSLGETVREINGNLKHELTRQRRAALPPLFKDMTTKNLVDARQHYAKPYRGHDELKLFDERMRGRSIPSVTRLILMSPVVDLDKFCDPLNDAVLFVKLWHVPELATIILRHLMPNLRVIAGVASICRKLGFLVSRNMETWNSTTGEFLMDEGFRDEGGVRANILTIASTAIEQKRTATPYADSYAIMRSFIETVNLTNTSFRDIIIDQLPLFDVRMFETMIQSMPNLETVAISRCLLLDFSKLTAILKAIQRHPREIHGKKRYLKVDFAPYFFDGPNQYGRVGSFGVTYNEPTFNIPKAATCLLLSSYGLAKEVGMDLLSDYSSFWNFFRRLPGPDPLWAFKVRDTIVTYGIERASAMGSHLVMGDDKLRLVNNRFADDITAAVSGDNMEPSALSQRVGEEDGVPRYGFWREKVHCQECRTSLLCSFFNMNRKVCWACKLKHFVRMMEDSHLRHRQISILDDLFKGLVTHNTTFAGLVNKRDPALLAAQMGAEDCDRAWAYHLFHDVGCAPDSYKPDPKVPFPEPHNADSQAASLRRIRFDLQANIPAQDLREGGPQYLHPCRDAPSSALTTQPAEGGCESFELFARRWYPNQRAKGMLRDAFCLKINSAQRFQGPNLDMRDGRVKNYLELASYNQNELAMACWLEWVEQNMYDGNTMVLEHARAEDNIYSVIGPGKRSWNRDKAKERKHCSAEYQTYHESGHYRRGLASRR